MFQSTSYYDSKCNERILKSIRVSDIISSGSDLYVAKTPLGGGIVIIVAFK